MRRRGGQRGGSGGEALTCSTPLIIVPSLRVMPGLAFHTFSLSYSRFIISLSRSSLMVAGIFGGCQPASARDVCAPLPGR